MKNTMFRTKILKLRINLFTTIIRSYNFNFGGVLILNKILKVLEHNKQLTLLFKKKEPCKTCKIQ